MSKKHFGCRFCIYLSGLWNCNSDDNKVRNTKLDFIKIVENIKNMFKDFFARYLASYLPCAKSVKIGNQYVQVNK